MQRATHARREKVHCGGGAPELRGPQEGVEREGFRGVEEARGRLEERREELRVAGLHVPAKDARLRPHKGGDSGAVTTKGGFLRFCLGIRRGWDAAGRR